jgi:hypothetical protein
MAGMTIGGTHAVRRRDIDGLLLRANGAIRLLETGDDLLDALGVLTRPYTVISVPGWADQGFDLELFVLDESRQAVNLAATKLAETVVIIGDAVVVDDNFKPLPREVIDLVLALPNSRLAAGDARRCQRVQAD